MSISPLGLYGLSVDINLTSRSHIVGDSGTNFRNWSVIKADFCWNRIKFISSFILAVARLSMSLRKLLNSVTLWVCLNGWSSRLAPSPVGPCSVSLSSSLWTALQGWKNSSTSRSKKPDHSFSSKLESPNRIDAMLLLRSKVISLAVTERCNARSYLSSSLGCSSLSTSTLFSPSNMLWPESHADLSRERLIDTRMYSINVSSTSGCVT
ncbi:hypothetical protein OGATHE_004141 [Ogataea polymorpha]|uniref:Uncharacterized protein n=1 Tax=Ogataea polymorpha TaxID=460523 RepID=A0A9P8P4X8_9ASCO|nr:hypothetical protein OGATHE_004141 [Ogataea polymorpha]